MAKIRCKGTKLQQEIATVLTDVAQVISLEHSGAESETYDSTTLDQADAWKTYEPTGYSEPGSVDGELFYDPGLAGHMSMTDLLATPAAQNWAMVFANTPATTMEFAGAGISFGVAVDMGDGLKGSFSIKVSGDPDFST